MEVPWEFLLPFSCLVIPDSHPIFFLVLISLFLFPQGTYSSSSFLRKGTWKISFWKLFWLKLSSLLTFDLSGIEFQVENSFHLVLWRHYSVFCFQCCCWEDRLFWFLGIICGLFLMPHHSGFPGCRILFCLFQGSEFTMMWGFIHAYEHLIGLAHLDMTQRLSKNNNMLHLGFPGSTSGKESTQQGRRKDMGSISGSGRSPGGGNGNPLQCSCLENSKDRGAWWATVYGVTKRRTQLKQLSTHTHVTLGVVCLYHCFDNIFPIVSSVFFWHTYLLELRLLGFIFCWSFSFFGGGGIIFLFLFFFLSSGRFPQHCLWTLLLVVFCLFCYGIFNCQEFVFFPLISP